MKTNLPKQQGFLIIAAVVLIVIFAFLAATIAHITISSTLGTVDQFKSTQALYLAETGLEEAKYVLLSNSPADLSARIACGEIDDVTHDPIFRDVNFGSGQFTVTASHIYSSPATTLTSGIGPANTTINVADTSAYATTGRIMIDREVMSYSGVTGSSFTSVIRGVDGTTATNHLAGTLVGQNQCDALSLGGVSNLTTPSGKRQLKNLNIQLSEAWAVGNASGGEVFARWNGASWSRSGPYGGIPNRTLRGISMLSFADGWAAGNRRLFAHWNGTAWSLGSVTTSGPNTVPNENFFGIFCLNSNDCKAVGNSRSFAHWNGTTWSAPSITTTGPMSVPNVNMRSISCVAPNDCWAVGQRSGGVGTIARWTGTNWFKDSSLIDTSGANAVPDRHINGVSCISSSDCWAVGDDQGGNPNFIHWNGTIWSRSSAHSGIPNQDLDGIYCLASDDCWAVGQRQGGSALIVHWNGSTWSRVSAGTVPNVNLFAVHCAASDNCWGVGASSGGEVFGHWDGTGWTRIGPSSTIPNVNLRSVYVIAPKSQEITWQEVYK